MARNRMLLGVALLIVVMLTCAYFFRDIIVLKIARLDPESIIVLYTGVNERNEQYRVTKLCSIDDNRVALVYARKNRLGIWWIEMTSSIDGDITPIAWYIPKAIRTYRELTHVGFEKHMIYYGTNANQLFDLSTIQLDNVAVSVGQAENEYWIHFMCFDDTELPDHVTVDAILRNATVD